MEISWNNCFSAQRYGKSATADDDRTQYERDWDRIIFSSPFRRLQNKTQVFPLPEEIFVHNRLTHSLEVASVGRSLGQIIGEKLSEIKSIKEDTEAYHFYKYSLKNVIASACLAHDLGNPAFGHSGEDAISKFFKKKENASENNLKFKNQFSEQEWQDLTSFEGNANAFRILTSQQKGKGGFQLTLSTMVSILKYPCEASATNKNYIHRKKYGFFKIDENAFMEVVTKLNMQRDETVKNKVSFKRHPFVYLVEAADDISYNIIDFEDAHRLGILPFSLVKDKFLEIITTNPIIDIKKVKEKALSLEEDPNESIAYLRAMVINTLIYKCVNIFWENKEVILKGDFNDSLLNALPDVKDTMKEIKTISINKIYNARSVAQLEIAGYRIMSSLVEDFVNAALCPKDKRDKELQKILSLLPQQFKFSEADSNYKKVMCILDFISGMTDLYALKLYRKSRGIEL